MKTLQCLFLMALALSTAQAFDHKNLAQFRTMMLCVMPDSWPVFDYADYGCHCGKGGSGAPVDGLDKCCQVHDNCYADAVDHPECWYILDNPYIGHYFWSCDHDNRKPSCLSKNDECAMFICECDRMAAECFGRNTWNPDHEHLSSDQCV